MAAFASTSSHGCLGTRACAANVSHDSRRIEFAAVREHVRVSRNGAGGAKGDFE